MGTVTARLKITNYLANIVGSQFSYSVKAVK